MKLILCLFALLGLSHFAKAQNGVLTCVLIDSPSNTPYGSEFTIRYDQEEAEVVNLWNRGKTSRGKRSRETPVAGSGAWFYHRFYGLNPSGVDGRLFISREVLETGTGSVKLISHDLVGIETIVVRYDLHRFPARQ